MVQIQKAQREKKASTQTIARGKQHGWEDPEVVLSRSALNRPSESADHQRLGSKRVWPGSSKLGITQSSSAPLPQSSTMLLATRRGNVPGSHCDSPERKHPCPDFLKSPRVVSCPRRNRAHTELSGLDCLLLSSTAIRHSHNGD